MKFHRNNVEMLYWNFSMLSFFQLFHTVSLQKFTINLLIFTFLKLQSRIDFYDFILEIPRIPTEAPLSLEDRTKLSTKEKFLGSTSALQPTGKSVWTGESKRKPKTRGGQTYLLASQIKKIHSGPNFLKCINQCECKKMNFLHILWFLGLSR